MVTCRLALDAKHSTVSPTPSQGLFHEMLPKRAFLQEYVSQFDETLVNKIFKICILTSSPITVVNNKYNIYYTLQVQNCYLDEFNTVVSLY